MMIPIHIIPRVIPLFLAHCMPVNEHLLLLMLMLLMLRHLLNLLLIHLVVHISLEIKIEYHIHVLCIALVSKTS
jgi:hypothetical protein